MTKKDRESSRTPSTLPRPPPPESTPNETEEEFHYTRSGSTVKVRSKEERVRSKGEGTTETTKGVEGTRDG